MIWFSQKFGNTACIMPGFWKQFIIVHLYLVVLRWIIPLIWEIFFSTLFGGYALFQSCVGNKVTERITNRLLSETKISAFALLFQVNLWNDLLWTKFKPVQYYYNSFEPLGYFKDGVIPNYSCKVTQLQNSDIGNLRKFELFYEYFRPLRNVWNKI